MAKKKKTNAAARKKRVVAIVALVLAALFLIWTIAGSFMAVFAAETNTQTRMAGVWVSSVANIDYPTKQTTDDKTLRTQIDTIVKNCEEMGFNTIFFQVRPTADSLYKSDIFPWSRYLTGKQGTAPANGFDPLAYFVEKAHEKGIELHAWINPYRITNTGKGEAEWDNLVWNNPARGGFRQYVVMYKNNLYFDPAYTQVQDLIVDGVEEIVKNYDVDGIHLDDYFYPAADFDDSVSYELLGKGQDKADWRRDNVNKLIKRLDTMIHSYGKDLKFGVSPSGIWANAGSVTGGSNTNGNQHYSSHSADSVTWIRNGWVDYIIPQIYWQIGHPAADYDTLARWWNNIVDGTDVDLYIGMGDYRTVEATSSTDAFYGEAGNEMIRTEMELNQTLKNIKGEVHFTYGTFLKNKTLAEYYKNNRFELNNAVFSDINKHWAETYITRLYNLEMISGIGEGLFGPERTTSRAEFVKMLATVTNADLNYLPKKVSFSDVNDSAWYAPYVKWAAANNVVSGYGDENNCFGPDDPVTREQMASIIQRYCGNKLILIKSMTDFTDKNDISNWAYAGVKSSVEAGIFNGVEIIETNGVKRMYFYPKKEASRAEVATLMCNLYDNINGNAM